MASSLALLHFAAHVFWHASLGAARRPEEEAVLDAMKSYEFDAMGALITHWDVYYGSGLVIGTAILLHAVLFWQLATLARTDPVKARPFVATLLAAYCAFVMLYWIYFYAGPILVTTGIVVCLALAWFVTPGDELD
jgi:hypothetical protein